MHSPLRYPGGKSDFLSVARNIFEQGGFSGMPVVEPYSGSAAVSLGLLDLGLTPKVTLLERDPLLYAFWKCVFECPEELIVKFQDTEITLDNWNGFQAFLKLDAPDDQYLLDMALAALFLNRANFSGILNAGPIGGKSQTSEYKIDCRTNKDDIICRILALAMHSGKVEVLFGDAVELLGKLSKRKDLFIYLDPPYYNKGELLYRYYYKLKHHKALAQVLSAAKFKWLLSYDVHHVIEFLYEDFHVSKQTLRYSARSPKQHQELLISNFELAENALADFLPPRRQRHWPSENALESQAPGQLIGA